MILGIVIFVVGLMISIGLHEIGHLAPAKKFGVKVPQYFIGFGPTLWSTKKGETEYGLKAIPLGGYVRLAGMYPPRKEPLTDGVRLGMVEDARKDSRADLEPGEENRAFSALTVPKKLVVMFGGPFMNWMIALVLLSIVVLGFGLGNLTSRVSVVSECVPDAAGTCAADSVASPAQAAGFRPGDEIISWNGVPVDGWDAVTSAIESSSTDAPAVVEIMRDGQVETLTVTPVMRERLEADGTTTTVPFVGISPSFGLVRGDIGDVVDLWWGGTVGTVRAITDLPGDLWNTVTGLFQGEQQSDRQVVSIVGVGQLASDIVSTDNAEYTFAMRVVDMLTLLASLNIALFVFNLIPLPPLDGGHIAGAVVEGARRMVAKVQGKPDPGPVDTAKLLPVAMAVVMVLLVMTVILAWADIAQPIF